MFCSRCGAELFPEASFCYRCGSQVIAPAADNRPAERSGDVQSGASMPVAPVTEHNGLSTPGMMEKRPLWQHEAAIAWAMILVFPLGILLMWLYAPWRSRFKWMWTGIAAFLALMIVAGAAGGEGGNQSNAAHTAQEAAPTLTTGEIAYIHAVSAQQTEQATASAISAQQTAAARPTSTPRPTPKPYYDLKVISFSWHTEYGYAIAEGFVENESGKTLEQVEAVANFYDANGTPITSDSALIDYDPLLPGQQSPYKVMARYNPAMSKCGVEFKEFMGGTFKTDTSAIR